MPILHEAPPHPSSPVPPRRAAETAAKPCLTGRSEAANRGAGESPAARPCSPTGAQGLVRYTAPHTARANARPDLGPGVWRGRGSRRHAALRGIADCSAAGSALRGGM